MLIRTLAVLLSFLVMPAKSMATLTIQQMLQQGDPAYFPENDLKPQEIAYSEWNKDGKEVIILIHGLGGSRDGWNGVAKLFDKKYRIIALDQRGHGQTGFRGLSFSSTTMAHDVLTLMNYLKIDKATLVGHSMGGRTALRFGELFPERTSAIIVEDMHAMGRRTLLNSPEEYLRQGGARPDGYSTSLYASQGLQEDLTDAVSAIDAPLLFIKGARGAVLHGLGVDRLFAISPQVKVVEIPNTSHGVHWDAPKVYVNLIEEFLRSKGSVKNCESILRIES